MYLNIHDLPTDVLVHIFSLLRGQDIARCIEVCHCFADLVRSDLYLQYTIELAQNGMVDGHSHTLTTSERLQRLREYSSRFRSGRFDHEDLAAHPHYVHQMRNGQWNTSSVDESSQSTLHGSDLRIETVTAHSQDGPSDMFLSVFTPGSAQAGTQSKRSLLRIGTADEYAILITNWAIDGAQDLLVMTERADIAIPEHLRPQPDEFHLHFYSLSGSKTSGQTPHPAAMLPSMRVSSPTGTYDMEPMASIEELHIAGEIVIWELAVTERDEFRTVVAVFVGACNWRTGELISCINVGKKLVHVIPLDYPYFLLVPKASQVNNPCLIIYGFAPSSISSHPICILQLHEEEYEAYDWWETSYDVHTGGRPQTSDGHFHADLSLSTVVLNFYHEYTQDSSERETHYLIPRTTLLAQIRVAESRQRHWDTRARESVDSGSPGPEVQHISWADWGPHGCLRLSRRRFQAQRAAAVPFGSRLPLFVVDDSDSRSASVYVFDINPHVARYQSQVHAGRKHDTAAGTGVGIVEDIEAFLPGVVDPGCSSIPYVVYRFPLPCAPGGWQVGQFVSAVVMGMTGFTIKISGVEYEKREQTWTV